MYVNHFPWVKTLLGYYFEENTRKSLDFPINSSIFEATVPTTLPEEQRTRVGLLLLYSMRYGYLVENFKPLTVNLRLQGINKYLEYTKHDILKMKFVKVQQKNFLENVISDADYKFLKAKLKADGHDEWYFIVWFMAATGARVSE